MLGESHGRMAACPVVVEPVGRAARDFHAVHVAREVEALFAAEVTKESAVGAM